MASSSGDGGGSFSSTSDDDPHHPGPHDRAAARQAERYAGSSAREALGDEQMPSGRRVAQEGESGTYQRQLRGGSGEPHAGDPQAMPPLVGPASTSLSKPASALPTHLQGVQSVSAWPRHSSLLFSHVQQQQQHHQQQQQRRHLYQQEQQQGQQQQQQGPQQQQEQQQQGQQQQHMPFPSPNFNRGGADVSVVDMADPFLDALVNFEHAHGVMWDAWGGPSNLFASNSPLGARDFSGVVDNNGGGGGNPSISTTDRVDESGGGRVPGFSTFPPPTSSAAYRALPPLPSATAQQHPLPVQRTGSFDLPLVPPLLLGRHAGRDSVVRSDLNPHGGFIEREPPLLRAPSATIEEWRQRQRMHGNTDESQGGGGRNRERRGADVAGRGGSGAASTHVANPHIGQWPTAGHGGGWRKETIQSLLAAIPTVPPLAPPSLSSSRGGMAPRSYSELRPPPLVPSLQRSLSAPLGSLGGGEGDGRAFAPQPHGLRSSHSDGSIQGSGSLNSSFTEDPDRSFSFEASRGRERDSTVLGMSYGIGLNFPFADLDEAGRREYRRQRMLRWLEKRKRRTADRGITYSERSTLANRRERISGRFVKETNAFVSVTEFQRARAVGASGSKGGGGGGSRLYAVERQQPNDSDARIAGAFRLPKQEEDEDNDDEEEEEDDDSKQGEDGDGDDAEDGDFEQRPRR